MRVIFAGTPEFARTALQRLYAAGIEVPLVLTQPDRPAGRGMKLHESPVKVLARQHGMALAQPRSLRLDGVFASDAKAARAAIEDAHADAMVVAAYGLILPQWVLDAMRRRQGGARAGLGCINIHASLLPRWRGAAPIHRAIEAGDARTGVSIMQMDAGLDTGDILLARELPIMHAGPTADTTATLHDKLARLGAELIVHALELAAAGRLEARAQPSEGVSYARKVEKAQALVDWAASVQVTERRVRAFNPTPGAWTELGGQPVKLWRAEVASDTQTPDAASGTILGAGAAGIEVACGQGVLRLCELQRSGGKRLGCAEFLRGFPLHPGMRFGRGLAGA